MNELLRMIDEHQILKSVEMFQSEFEVVNEVQQNLKEAKIETMKC